MKKSFLNGLHTFGFWGLVLSISLALVFYGHKYFWIMLENHDPSQFTAISILGFGVLWALTGFAKYRIQ